MRRPSWMLLLLGLLLAACAAPATHAPARATVAPTLTAAPPAGGAITATVASGPTETPPPPVGTPSPGAGPTPPTEPKTITPADLGQTVRLAVGETFTLRLGDGTAWDVQITDPRVIAPVQTATPPPGEQGVYQARAAGVTELLAVATPPCVKDQPPCRVLAPAFRLLIVVR